MEPIALHRWSGWPGAWCLDCGIYDPLEECIAVHDVEGDCPDHPSTLCPEPNSRRHDPYSHDIIDLKDIVD
jgi:hypothetical protein